MDQKPESWVCVLCFVVAVINEKCGCMQLRSRTPHQNDVIKIGCEPLIPTHIYLYPILLIHGTATVKPITLERLLPKTDFCICRCQLVASSPSWVASILQFAVACMVDLDCTSFLRHEQKSLIDRHGTKQHSIKLWRRLPMRPRPNRFALLVMDYAE